MSSLKIIKYFILEIKFDCRGHPILEEVDKKEFIKHIEQLLSSSILLDSFGEKAGQSMDDLENENTLVVSFYLLTREAGLLFQGMSQIIHFCEKNSLESLIEASELENLAKLCFESLLSVKHLGSIERISTGITRLCATIYESKNPIIPNLAENLAVEVINHLEKNHFTNSLRRSAGLPPAIVCLLNSEIAGKKIKILPLVMEKLFIFFELPLNEENVQIKIHSLNILK